MARLDDLDRLTTPPQFARLILSILEEQGVAPNYLLHGTGLAAEALKTTEHNISFRQMLALIGRAQDLSPTPDLGLIVGCRETVGTWGVLGYALMSCATEKEAIDVAVRFQRASSGVLAASHSVEGDQMRVEFSSLVPLGRSLRFCVEEMIAGIAAVVPDFMEQPFHLHQVSVSYSKPDYADQYDRLFDCPVLYDQPHNAIWTNVPTDRPLRNGDPASAAMCMRMVEELVERHKEEEDLILQTRKILLATPGDFADMEHVASELSISSRTLRRRLEELGTSFKEILDDVRRNLALDYLCNSQLTIDQIAVLLGYTETTNFRRAFKQWTNHPPSHFR